jgi:hypothetical protein
MTEGASGRRIPERSHVDCRAHDRDREVLSRVAVVLVTSVSVCGVSVPGSIRKPATAPTVFELDGVPSPNWLHAAPGTGLPSTFGLTTKPERKPVHVAGDVTATCTTIWSSSLGPCVQALAVNGMFTSLSELPGTAASAPD